MRVCRSALLLLIVVMVSACSTTTSRFETADASPEAALKSYTQLGLQYLQAGDTASAKAPLQRALAINPNYAPAYNALALVFQTENDSKLAETYFRRALESAPSSAMIHNNFGAFLFAQKRYQEACQELARATEDPFYNLRAQAFENMGRCYRQIGRDDVAEHAFRRALALSRMRPIAMIQLADLLLKQNRPEEAAQLFARFKELVDARRVEHSALSLWVGVRVARYESSASRAATYALLLKNMYPESAEYRLYKESAQ